jgi:NTE family protein
MDWGNRTAALALGSGAARGLAHIGVLRALNENGIRIGGIAGCSMGALIGGIYAAGRLDEYENWVSQLDEIDVLRLLDVSWGARAGLLKGDLIIEALRELIGDYEIGDLSVPFVAVATDMRTRREVWINDGSLFDAIRASIAIPGVFRPVQRQRRVLLDGGLLNPVPIAPTSGFPTDLTVAVSVTSPPVREPLGPARHATEPPREQEESYREQIEAFFGRVQEAVKNRLKVGDGEKQEELTLLDVILGSIETMQETITRFKLAAYQPDMLIEIPSNVCDAHEFYRAADIIRAGEHWARKALEQWKEDPRNAE